MSSLPPVGPSAEAPRSGHVAVRVVVAVGSIVCIASAAVVVYRHYEPAQRDSGGAVVHAGRLKVHDLRIGDCLDETPMFDKRSTYVRAVPCSTSHRTEVYAITAVSGLSYPGTTEINNRARAACAVHPLPGVAASYSRWFMRPEAKSWKEGDRRVTCMVVAPTDLTRTFSR